MATATLKVQRQDTIRNKRALLTAVGALLQNGGDKADPQVTMPAVAEQAQLAVSTAYRYFPTLEDLYSAYICSVVEPLADYSKSIDDGDGKALFSEILGKWIELVGQHGATLTKVRSREGFLGRFAQGDPLTSLLADCWGRPVRGLMNELSVPEDQFPAALALCMAFVNSRQIKDLLDHLWLSPAELIQHVTDMYVAALATLGTNNSA